MNVVVSYHDNEVRMSYIITKLLSEYPCTLYPVRGNMVISGGKIRWIGEPIEILLISTDHNPTILFTSNSDYKGSNGKSVEYDLSRANNLCEQLLTLCRDKFITSGNHFSLQCSSDCMSMAISPSSTGSLLYTMQYENNEVVLEADGIAHSILDSCNTLQSFSYKVDNESCSKEVSVSKGVVEILREIAHYTNKVLYFTVIDDCKVVRRVAIASTGIVEITPTRGKPGELYARKVQPNKLRVPLSASVFAVDCSLDSILRTRNIFSQLEVS